MLHGNYDNFLTSFKPLISYCEDSNIYFIILMYLVLSLKIHSKTDQTM